MSKPATAKATVLIVDDDPDFRATYKVRLEAEGYTVLEADENAEAEKILAAENVQVAVVDLMMEEEDSGFQLCYHIKKTHPGMGVIMVTNVASETGIEFDAATEEERAWVKADALLDKPVRIEQLVREIERLS